VGSIDVRKNVLNLLRAYAQSGARSDFALVIVGAPGHGGEKILEQVGHLGIEDRLHCLGYLPNTDLPGLYAGASAFLFPTHYEGFGLPILEAMACGTPVLTGTKGAAPEIAGGHAVLVEPEDPAGIAHGIDKVLTTTEEACHQARAYAAKFTWESCALSVLEVYKEALQQSEQER
jgi:glycosyltransferase involved in cell wall biosynthesis